MILILSISIKMETTISLQGTINFSGDDGRVYIRLGPIMSSSGNTAIGTGNLRIDTDSTNSKPRLGAYTRAFDWDGDGSSELIVLEKRTIMPHNPSICMISILWHRPMDLEASVHLASNQLCFLQVQQVWQSCRIPRMSLIFSVWI